MRILIVLALLMLSLVALGGAASAEHGSGAGGITPTGNGVPTVSH